MAKAINLESEEEEIEDIPRDDEDLRVEMKDIEAQGAKPVTKLPEYLPLPKGMTKVPKDIDTSKVPLKSPLLPDEIFFEGLCFGRVPLLKLEDWDLADCGKFLRLSIK